MQNINIANNHFNTLDAGQAFGNDNSKPMRLFRNFIQPAIVVPQDMIRIRIGEAVITPPLLVKDLPKIVDKIRMYQQRGMEVTRVTLAFGKMRKNFHQRRMERQLVEGVLRRYGIINPSAAQVEAYIACMPMDHILKIRN